MSLVAHDKRQRDMKLDDQQLGIDSEENGFEDYADDDQDKINSNISWKRPQCAVENYLDGSVYWHDLDTGNKSKSRWLFRYEVLKVRTKIS